MYVLFAVIKDEQLIDDLITGWLDIGVTGATVLESTDSLQLISRHIPIFAGFRTLTSGGMPHNKTVFTLIDSQKILDQAVAFLQTLCLGTEKPHQGIYFVIPVIKSGRLGREVTHDQRHKHLEKKMGRSLKPTPEPAHE